MTGNHDIRANPAMTTSVLTTEKGEKCLSCGMVVTNSQPDCRCS